jgi:hypothetical protein
MYQVLKGKQTRVDLLLTQSEFIHSSGQEQLLQILEMIQSDFHHLDFLAQYKH